MRPDIEPNLLIIKIQQVKACTWNLMLKHRSEESGRTKAKMQFVKEL